MSELKFRGAARLTIIDLTDGRRVVALISPNKQTSVIYDPDTNKYLPDYKTDPMVLTPMLKVEGHDEDLASSAKEIRWAYQKNSIGSIIDITENDDTFTLGSGSVKTLTIKKNIFALDQSIRIYCYITYTDTVTKREYLGMATIELQKLVNGSSGKNAIIAALTNDAQYLSVSDFSETKFSNVTTTMNIFDGIIDVSANWTFSKEETTGIHGTLNGNVYTLDTFEGEHGEVRITASRTGFTSVTKVFTLVKIKNGQDGSSIDINTNSPVIKKSESGAYSPSKLEINALYKVGLETPNTKEVAFVVSESTSPSGTEFTQKYASSALETHISYTPSPNISLVKIEIFTDIAKNTKVDEEIIPIVLDGKDSVLPIISTPNGVVSRNGDKNFILKLDIYKGLNVVTGSFYQWYMLDSEAEGDSNSGSGWRRLLDQPDETIKGSTTSTLEISPKHINGTETLLVVSSFLGSPLKATVDLSDLSDPYTISILGTSIFKNGEGENKYTAKLYRAGEEIDSDIGNYRYKYNWFLYDSSNHKIPSFSKQGKQITIVRDDINSTGYLVVEVKDTSDNILGTNKIDLTDLSDAIISGSQPSSTIEGQLWIDTSNGGNVLKVYHNGTWQIQELDVTKLDSGLATTIETITQTLGSIANDNELNLQDRIVIAGDVAKIIGHYPSTSSTLIDEVLPDSLDLISGGIGDFCSSWKAALNLGISTSIPEMEAVKTTWDALRNYLNNLGNNTVKAWDITEVHKDLIVEVEGDEFRSKFLAYYNAQLELQSVILSIPGPEGESAVSAMLDNDSATIPTDSSGGNGIYDTAVTQMLVYLGTADVTKNWKFTEAHSEGLTLTLTKNRVQITEITVDTGWVDITATADGFPSLTRRFTVTRQKEAIDGQDVEMKWLSVSTPTFAKDPLGVYFPLSATLSSYHKVGQGAIYGYPAVFTIEESSNGKDYLEVFNNANEPKTEHVYIPSKNLKFVRITLTEPLSGTEIDVQTITIVSDGKDGKDGEDGYTPIKGVDYFDGRDGYTPVKGVDYFDGISSHLHLKYSNDGGETFTANNGTTPGTYVGIYLDTVAEDSNDPKRYKWTKLAGNDAVYYQLLLSGYVFKYSSDNRPEPANQVIDITSTYGGGDENTLPVISVYGINSDGTRTKITPQTAGRLVPSDMGTYSTLEVEGTYMGIIDKTFVSRIRDGFVGADGITSYLTNSSHTIVTDPYGNNGSYAGAVTELKISSGNTDETSHWSITVDYDTSKLTGTLNGATFTVTSINADVATVTFTATRSGKPTIKQVFTVTRLKKAENLFSLITDSSSGNVFNNNVTTVLSGRVFKGNTDITNELPASAFVWKRTSSDSAADATWNSNHRSMKTVIITSTDIIDNVGIFDCDVEFDETSY